MASRCLPGPGSQDFQGLGSLVPPEATRWLIEFAPAHEVPPVYPARRCGDPHVHDFDDQLDVAHSSGRRVAVVVADRSDIPRAAMLVKDIRNTYPEMALGIYVASKARNLNTLSGSVIIDLRVMSLTQSVPR